jgi:membrane protein implicated in regulation of membrane protease activity
MWSIVMEFYLEAWQWIVLGLFLAGLEIFLASFTILWFGIAAIIVGIIAFIFPQLSIEAELLIWLFSSIALAILWFKVIMPNSVNKTMSGLPREAILGQIGMVTVAPTIDRVGVIRFPMPVLGSDEWRVRSTDVLAVGDRVAVTEILGNELVVNKI